MIHRAYVGGFWIEDPYHFLFTCPLYVQIRVVASFECVQAFIRTRSRFKHIQQPCRSERIIGVNVSMCVVHNVLLYSFCVSFYCHIPGIRAPLPPPPGQFPLVIPPPLARSFPPRISPLGYLPTVFIINM